MPEQLNVWPRLAEGIANTSHSTLLFAQDIKAKGMPSYRSASSSAVCKIRKSHSCLMLESIYVICF